MRGMKAESTKERISFENNYQTFYFKWIFSWFRRDG